jgi:hypothetical protein
VNVDDPLFALLLRTEEAARMPRASHFTVTHQTYHALWDFHERLGERPWAYQFHALARRRLAKELARCLW